MNKKYGFIFLGIGVIFIILFVLYNYTNLFTGKSPNNDKPGNTITYTKDDFNYDFLKSHNTDTKISFPIDKSLKKDSGGDYYKLYKSDNGNSLEATINSSNGLIEDYIDEAFNSFKTKYSEYRVEKNSITCNNRCERYKVYKQDNSLLVDEFRLFVDLSSKERVELKYHFEDKELLNEYIDFIAKNIDFINDVTNTTGKLVDNRLYIDFEIVNSNAVSISLDSNVYEEIINKDKSMYSTSVRNKNTKEIINLSILFKESNETFDKKINKLYNDQSIDVIPTKKNVDILRFSEYKFGKRLLYMHIIDDNTALLIDAQDGQILIGDFSRIVIIDV